MSEPVDYERVTVVLERVVQDYVPDYSVYGTTICPPCGEMVYVGHESARAIDKGAWPLCMECALKIQAEHPDQFGPQHVIGNVEDATCPKCGMIHGA